MACGLALADFARYIKMHQTECHDVIIDYGDGTNDRFKLKVTPDVKDIVPIYEVKLKFECVTNPKVKLEFVTDTTRYMMWECR